MTPPESGRLPNSWSVFRLGVTGAKVYQAAGVAYSRSQKTFFIWHNDCGEAVLADAIMSAGFQE